MGVVRQVTIGLYRHFKGAYYYVTSISRNANNYDEYLVNYFDICHPEKVYTRPLVDFIATTEEDGRLIKDRPDNITGQSDRFARVYDLNWQISSMSTEQLIEELRRRTDSPIHELDLEGLRSPIVSKDFVVGEVYEATKDTPKGVYTLASFETVEEAKNYFSTHKTRNNAGVFKRTFIEVV